MLAHRENLDHIRLNLVQHKEHLGNLIFNMKMMAGRVSPKEYIDLMDGYLPSCAADLRAILFITPWIVTSSCDPDV
jgi:hypothetical protein